MPELTEDDWTHALINEPNMRYRIGERGFVYIWDSVGWVRSSITVGQLETPEERTERLFKEQMLNAT